MFQRILLATDGSETAHRAVEFCIALKKRLPDLEISVLTVTPTLEGAGGAAPGMLEIPSHLHFQDRLDEQAQHWRDDAVALFRTAGLEVGTESGEGDAAGEIVRIAEEKAYDHIVIGSHGRSAIRSLVMGSVTNKVLQYAKCPVTVVKAVQE